MGRFFDLDHTGRTRAWSAVVCAALMVVLLMAGCSSKSPGTPVAPPAVQPPASGDFNALLTSAQAALDSGNLPAAEQSYRAAVGQNARSAAAQFGLGNVLVRAGKLAEAESAYKAALAADPGMAAAHANLGVTYYQMGQLTKAADEFTATLKANPNDAATTYLLGAVRLQENNLPEAEKLLLKARDLDPKLPEAYYGLGALYKLKGQKTEAIAAFNKFLEIGPGQDPQAMEFARNELKALQGQ
jgi:tetratricopeptide (TPR) repeat protein